MDPGSKITILTNGPLTSLAKIIQNENNTSSVIQVSGLYLLFSSNLQLMLCHAVVVHMLMMFQMSSQDVYVVGGHISHSDTDKGNVLTIDSNEYTELNMFLDPLAAKTVFESSLDITLIPLGVQRRVSSFPEILERLRKINTTPEALFAQRLLSRLYHLKETHRRYQQMVRVLILACISTSENHNPRRKALLSFLFLFFTV